MKRPVLALALLTLGGLIVLLIVFFVASRDIPPPDTTDLTPEHLEVPTEQNAYPHFLAAAKSLYWPRDFRKDADYLAGKPTDQAVIEEVLTRNTETLEEVQQGLECQIPLDHSGLGASAPGVGKWEDIGKVMAMKVRHDRLAGHYADATSTCIAFLRDAIPTPPFP